MQLWHCGRIVPGDYGLTPIAPSEVPWKREGKPDIVPKAATKEDIERIKQEFKAAAERGKRAGFDGV